MLLSVFPMMTLAKPAVEVITHAGAGGGTDVNSRMMMIRTRRTLKQDMVVVNKPIRIRLITIRKMGKARGCMLCPTIIGWDKSN